MHHRHLSARPLQNDSSADQLEHPTRRIGQAGAHISITREREACFAEQATEAAIDFARLAGFEPAGVIVEIMNEDGTMSSARMPRTGGQSTLKLVSIADLIEHRLQNEALIERVKEMEIQTAFGPFTAVVFRQSSNEVEHVALVKGTWEENDEVPVRVHSTSMLGDVFQITDFGKGPMLHAAMKKMDDIGCGVLVYLNKLRQGGGILDELTAYKRIQESAQSSPVRMDTKDYGIGAQIIQLARNCQYYQQRTHPRSHRIRTHHHKDLGLDSLRISIEDRATKKGPGMVPF